MQLLKTSAAAAFVFSYVLLCLPVNREGGAEGVMMDDLIDPCVHEEETQPTVDGNSLISLS